MKSKVIPLIILLTLLIVGCVAHDAESAVTTFDKRNHAGFPIAVKVQDFALSSNVTVDGLQEVAEDVRINGAVNQLIVTLADLSISSALSVTLENESGHVVYTSPDYTESTTTITRLTEDTAVFLVGVTTIKTHTLSTQVQAVDDAARLILYYKDD